MHREVDHADEQVKGLSRLAPPTKLSKWLLTLFAPAGWTTFLLAYTNPNLFFLGSLAKDHLHTAAIALGLAVALLFVLVMVLDVSLFIHHNKHKRFSHWVNENPLMSFEALWRNARWQHWFSLVLLCAAVFAAGYYVGKT